MLGRVATAFELPVVLSTVYVKHGMTGTNPELREALPGVPEIDRTTMNSWEDPEFRAAVEAHGAQEAGAGRAVDRGLRRLPGARCAGGGLRGLRRGRCDRRRQRVAHESAMQRMVQAGAVPSAVLGLACELQRDWGREGADRLRGVMREYFGRLRALKS